MKKYIAPELTETAFRTCDVIAASPLLDFLEENNYETRSFTFDDVTTESESE